MLLTGGMKSTQVYKGSRSPQAIALHWNPPGFHKKKIGCFSNRVVYIWKGCIGGCEEFKYLGGKIDKKDRQENYIKNRIKKR